MSEQSTDLRSALLDELGSGLRVLGHHEGGEWSMEYNRDGLGDAYDTEALDAIADDLALTAVATDHQEDLYDLGAVRATVRVFDEGVVIHVPTGGRDGYLVSVEHREGLVGRDVVAIVREHATGTKR